VARIALSLPRLVMRLAAHHKPPARLLKPSLQRPAIPHLNL